VRYRADGTRDFVYNIRHAACGRLHLTDPAREILGAADHLHVMGSTLSAPEFVEANLDAARAIKARGGTVSFDPNLRKEVLAAPGVRDAMEKFLALADLFLPSGEEITLLTEARTSDDAAEEILRRGPRAIVHKQGMDGARYYDRDGSRFAPAFPVEEIDPTGAGDCYGAAFTALWLRGAPVEEALTLAAAAGALAVTRRGPMEGASDLATLRAFVAAHRSSVA
jgi:sugar/nucleoside kinase (ribokinase family)